MRIKRIIAMMCVVGMILPTVACGSDTGSVENSSGTNDTEAAGNTATMASLEEYTQDDAALAFDNSAWKYDAQNDVYWQIGVSYCSTPETTDYETMGIYVPGAYMTAEENGDGTYTCTINTEGTVSGYTAETAPIVFPVNTAGYSAQEAPTSYSYDGVSEYLEAGFIYVYAGMRGRSNGYDENENLIYSGGAPWGVTDLKAAVRYYRYNEEMLPGNTDEIYTFGHSGGGAQSAVMGASGDSELYYEYLMSIGAAMYDTEGTYISDAISGAMCWCPITSLDYANEAYEWNMGQYASTGTRAEGTYTSELSEDLAEAYATYINELGLTDEDGTVLMLSESEDGIYTSGTYYDYLLATIEESLNNFLADTEFPYTSGGSMEMADGGFGGAGAPSGDGMPSGEMPSGEKPSGEKPSGEMPSGEMPSGEMPSGEMPSGEMPSGEMPAGGMASDESVTYETAQDYIDALNEEKEWIAYDAETNTVKITSIEAFATYCKTASKDVCAFDDLNLGQAENLLFGNDENDALHFDSTLAKLLEENAEEYASYSDWDSSLVAAYAEALEELDKFGNTIEERQNMYNPMYYLCDYYEGAGSSNVAEHWRIRSGIEQGDTALTVETNLALALESCEDVSDVDFETVWEQGHTTAERTGDSTENFIAWVNECVAQ